ncbi:MAG: substrate-binding domain-containing protein [Bacteroidia bacterium]
MSDNLIRLGGVAEHFNLPIHLAIEQGQFASRGVAVTWTDFHGGTGEMTQALRQGTADVCVLLTEGIITDIFRGNPSKIISEYVITSLIWGIHTGAANVLRHTDEIFDRRYAISRRGSGSHLMAAIDAHSRGHALDEEQFRVVGNLDGALQSLGAGESDVFYWEKFTTKPYVDAGRLRRIGEFITPWPCFVIAATDDILRRQPDNVVRVLRAIHDSCDDFMRQDTHIAAVSARYGLTYKDAERWYHSTEWAIHGWVSDKMLKSVVYHLQSAGVIPADAAIPELIWRR